MTTLCELGEKYGVDKCPAIFHSYTPEYDRILSEIRNSARLFVEIGIGFPELMCPIVGSSYLPGASLRMWRDYFPNAQIIGCDIRHELMFEEERIQCHFVDQSNPDSLRDLIFPTAADVILDDGSHEPSHMILTFQILWNNVREGGFYIIEDIRRENLAEFEQLGIQFPDCHLVYSHPGKGDWDSFVCFQKRL